jgi:hypothetical protein
MTRSESLHYLASNLSRSSNWRRVLAQKFDDPRNERAADSLFALAGQVTDFTNDNWNRISELNPTNQGFYEAVSNCSRDVGFRTNPRDFDAYVSTVIAALALVSA